MRVHLFRFPVFYACAVPAIRRLGKAREAWADGSGGADGQEMERAAIAFLRLGPHPALRAIFPRMYLGCI